MEFIFAILHLIRQYFETNKHLCNKKKNLSIQSIKMTFCHLQSTVGIFLLLTQSRLIDFRRLQLNRGAPINLAAHIFPFQSSASSFPSSPGNLGNPIGKQYSPAPCIMHTRGAAILLCHLSPFASTSGGVYSHWRSGWSESGRFSLLYVDVRRLISRSIVGEECVCCRKGEKWYWKFLSFMNVGKSLIGDFFG